MTTELVSNFLQCHFDPGISDVALIGAGMFSQAFSFAAQQFASSQLPIPKMVRSGRFDETYYFAITERCKGVTLNDLEKKSIEQTLPSLFDTLHTIHTLDSLKYSGWGLTDASGNGRFPSWQDYLLSFYNQKIPFTWEQLFCDTCMEQEWYDNALVVIQHNLQFCCGEKFWVHGDFGFDNVMSDGGRVTGVLDWAESLLGDYVYDIAYLEFWSDEICYKQRWQEWITDEAINVPLHFEQRLRCYMLHIGLKGLAIAAIRNDIEDYLQVKARMQKAFDFS